MRRRQQRRRRKPPQQNYGPIFYLVMGIVVASAFGVSWIVAEILAK
jgi:hypothetical protein